jgi:outer membrane receptor for Fe3+-dicitrate
MAEGQFARRGESLARLKGSAALWALIAGLSASPAFAQQNDAARPDAQQTPTTTAQTTDQSAATAQTTDQSGVPQPTASGQIVITGFRSSLAASLREKRNANGVVDVIKAEDIAKFPDNNLAESIQRIPGVTITRDQGEGRNISVRGLGPIYT